MRRPVIVTGLGVVMAASLAGIAGVMIAGATTAPDRAVATAAGSPTAQAVSASDFCFVEAMILYRVEAQELGAVVLAMEGVSAGTRAFAEEVIDAQSTELEPLRGWYVDWLDSRPLERDDVGACVGHADHDVMPGMPTRTQRGELSAADGTTGERMFLDLLAGQNAGVADVAGKALSAAPHPLVAAAATAAVAEAEAEAARIVELLELTGDASGQ